MSSYIIRLPDDIIALPDDNIAQPDDIIAQQMSIYIRSMDIVQQSESICLVLEYIISLTTDIKKAREKALHRVQRPDSYRDNR